MPKKKRACMFHRTNFHFFVLCASHNMVINKFGQYCMPVAPSKITLLNRNSPKLYVFAVLKEKVHNLELFSLQKMCDL